MGAKKTTTGRRVAQPAPKRQRRTTQAMICGGVFVLLVGMKILLPQTTFDDRIGQLLTHNMDVEAVFALVGNLGDQENITDQLHQAVFGEEPIVQEESVPQEEPEDITIIQSTGTIVEEATVYSQENLPENVSMEQMVLGFAYESPVNSVVTSPFGYRTEDGVTRFHYGVDLAGSVGDAICAFADGTVRAVGESSSYGQYLIIDHANGFATLYAHCSSICVTTDAMVTMGQEIAQVGETGMVTGPHLHLELMYNNLYLNPIYYVEN